MIVLGGVTRLTRSGLSMVDWRPQGSWLPRTEEEWEAEFNKYKEFPEYQLVNRSMSLDEFKRIFFIEWFHRMVGRGLGLFVAIPAAGFLAMGMIPGFAKRGVGLAFVLGACQGVVGWWMVKSGLEARDPQDRSVPRVSPYRLTAHFAMAAVVYSVLTWTTMNVFQSMRPVMVSSQGRKVALRTLRPYVGVTTALVALTALSGGFVAGNDAGNAFNDWPYFAGRIVPEGIWKSELGPRNAFENTATVQFDHRMLAYSTLAAVAATVWRWKRGNLASALPARVNRAVVALGGVAVGQVALGISTLMLYVPVSLGAAHQAGAMILWTAVLALRHAMREAAGKGVNAAAGKAAGTQSAAAAGTGVQGISRAALVPLMAVSAVDPARWRASSSDSLEQFCSYVWCILQKMRAPQ